jgi:hypothetical protein
MSCCQPTTRRAFLETKLKNFRKFVEPLCLLDEHKAYFDKFNDVDSAMPYLLQCVALQKAGKLDAAVDSFFASLPACETAVVDKVKRYMAMFVEVLTS